MTTRSILIVDDNRMLATMAGRVLAKSGYETTIALSGQEGLQKARDWVPDLIILDIVMPGMDGYEVARQLQQDPATAEIPIIFLSARGNTDDREGSSALGLQEINRAFELGASDFLHKPVAASELTSAVTNIFHLYDSITV